jgi:hypothetical protein
MRHKLVVAFCAVAVAGMGAGGALAGEVKGPPGTPGVPGSAQPDGSVPSLSHANSICASSGLNDMLSNQGQIDQIVQNFGVDVSGRAPSEPADPHVFNPGTGCNPTQGGTP